MIQIRTQEEPDFNEVQNIVRQAFWNLYVPGANEHFIVHKMRSHQDFIKELSLVAVKQNKIIGHIAYIHSYIQSDEGQKHKMITFGPLSVLPLEQGNGVGSMLVKKSFEIARKLQHKGVVIQGYPRYYQRFGFVNGKKFEISAQDGTFPKALQVLQLQEGYLTKVKGRLNQSELFGDCEQGLQQFDSKFQVKQKFVTPSQYIFSQYCPLLESDPEPQGMDRMNDKTKIE